jgi:cytochrome c oxidase subunit III
MGEVVTYPNPHAEQTKTAYMGMVIFLGGWAMTFIAMFMVYGAMRISVKSWPPLGLPLLPLVLPTINTLVIAASSAVLELGLRGVRNSRDHRLAPALLVASVLGVVFLLIQWIVGSGLYEQGLTPERGAYAAVVYGFSIIHAAHLIIGVIALLVLTVMAFRSAFTPAKHLTVRIWAAYWHFVGIVWALMYLFVFVI